MSLVVEQAAFLLDEARFVLAVTAMGFTVTGKELGRTADQQAIYVKTGRSTTMNSNHLRNCAIDLYFFKDGKLIMDKATLQPLGDLWESYSPKNRWGGNWKSFKDVPHFERVP